MIVHYFDFKNLELRNYDLQLKLPNIPISFDLGSFSKTLWVVFPHASDCNARCKSLIGTSVSCAISYKKTPVLIKVDYYYYYYYCCYCFATQSI